MDPDGPTRADRAPLDDAALAVLVRDVVDDWSLPPQRLDALTWRDRVGRRQRAGNGRSGSRWTRGLRGLAAVAVVATVSLVFGAVWLTAPRGDNGAVTSSPSPGASSTPAPSGSAPPTASPMPKLLRNGDLPTPSRIMTLTGRGYRIADLATGELGDVLIEVGFGPTAVLPRPGGGWVCICGEGQNVVQLALRTIDANGVVGAPTPLRDVVSTLDPSVSDDQQRLLPATGVTATVSPNGRYGLIGWIRRDGEAGWQVGADVLDLETLETVDSTDFLLDEPATLDGLRRVRQAPLVRMSPAGDRILLTSIWFVDGGSGQTGADHWLAPFDGVSIGALTGAGATTGNGFDDGCMVSDTGLIDVAAATDDAAYYTECFSPDRPITVRRVAADGRLVTSTEIPGALGGVDGTIAPPSGDSVFLWNPFESVLSRVDLGTGELSVGQPQRPNPKGLAKSGNLIVVSADGARVYTLGVVSDDGSADGAGVFAFDASTLAPLGHWAPQADLSSIAVSDDGRHVYAAASGGPSPAGAPGPEFGASITAYDTSDGSVAVIAGRLGSYDLTLGEGICR
jgi:hypothetical protein